MDDEQEWPPKITWNPNTNPPREPEDAEGRVIWPGDDDTSDSGTLDSIVIGDFQQPPKDKPPRLDIYIPIKPDYSE